jgi:hypothetical protein
LLEKYRQHRNFSRLIVAISSIQSIQGGTHMKKSNACIVAAMLALSGTAFAQSGGGGGAAGGGGNGAGMSASDQTGAASSTRAASSKMSHKSKSKAKKPMTDSTNTPGADASSDTKGQ